ncbi:MAG: 2-hydroxyacyl-CoA dehydratase [Xanthomonadaceae bacterium]|nr:2-hydroxyacyl-CoA dehydratase [Xanthomonadaceae bacterium]MDE2177936.1 2-hydroxyacyl-CoA dehydratase [Xanthomonadaceae bacterium]
MAVPQDAFRRFQEELAALERAAQQRAPDPTSKDAVKARARAEFLALRERYGLSVADVIGFFPEEEGIEYLRRIIAESETRPPRARKRQAAHGP